MKRPLRLLAALSSPAAIALTHAARAQDAAPAGPALIAEYAGDWQVTDAEATKTCSVTLDAEATIGGSVTTIAPVSVRSRFGLGLGEVFRFELGRDGVELVGTPRADGNRRAVSCETKRRCAADAGRCASDGDDKSFHKDLSKLKL